MVATGLVVSESPTRRGRRSWFGIVVVIAFVLAVGALAIPRVRDRVLQPRDSRWVELTSGTYAGVPWRLDAKEMNGQLCLSVDGPGGPSDTAHGYAGACGFENKPHLGADYYSSGPGPGGSGVTFGPLPSTATHIRVATNEVLSTAKLAHVQGMPSGRYWLEFIPPTGPSAAEGAALNRPQPLDAHGNPVKFARF